ncbi:protoheme IX farnesyltransferase [Synechococcus elongatus PCC 7942 = FACHB-805]|nr:protoheme IX farnesyltransferase [Synechococcus elongatus PCC 7942 = FACHB-805]
MGLAAQGPLDPRLAIATLIGGGLAAAAANTLNCLYDRDIDAIMERTRWRPLPSGRIQPFEAWAFALSLAALSFILLDWQANQLAAGLALAGIVFYVVIYTHGLKRHSSQNIVIGGAAGAIPPLVGWAAVTGELAWPAWILFAIVCLWTPPHFWALALMIRDDYAAVKVPMLPVVVGNAATAQQILAYAGLLLPTTLALAWPLGAAGPFYSATALLLGLELLRRSRQLCQAPDSRPLARSLFKFSIFYLMLLCGAIAMDCLPGAPSLSQAIAAWPGF